jgi:hypothetical protein
MPGLDSQRSAWCPCPGEDSCESTAKKPAFDLEHSFIPSWLNGHRRGASIERVGGHSQSKATVSLQRLRALWLLLKVNATPDLSNLSLCRSRAARWIPAFGHSPRALGS